MPKIPRYGIGILARQIVEFCEKTNIEPDMVRFPAGELVPLRGRALEAIRIGVSKIGVAGSLLGPVHRLLCLDTIDRVCIEHLRGPEWFNIALPFKSPNHDPARPSASQANRSALEFVIVLVRGFAFTHVEAILGIRIGLLVNPITVRSPALLPRQVA